MKHLWILLFLGLGWVAELKAQTGFFVMDIGASCKLIWEAPTTGGPVQGYKIYLQEQAPPFPQTMIDVGDVLEYSCETAGVGEGDWHFWVVAYNPGGDGNPSLTIPFSYFDLVRIDVGEPFTP